MSSQPVESPFVQRADSPLLRSKMDRWILGLKADNRQPNTDSLIHQLHQQRDLAAGAVDAFDQDAFDVGGLRGAGAPDDVWIVT